MKTHESAGLSIEFDGFVTFTDVFGDKLINQEGIQNTKIITGTIQVFDDCTMCEAQENGNIC